MDMKQIKIKRLIKKYARKMPDCLKPTCVSLVKWTETYHGDVSRYGWIVDQILSECEKNPNLDDGLRVTADGMLQLDERGVINHIDVLESFFGDEEVIRIIRYLRSENRDFRFYEKILNYVSDMTKDQIHALRESLADREPKDQDDARTHENILEVLRWAEQCAT